MAPSKTLPYKQFLTPVLHRRFTGAAVVILAFCYIEAILIGDKSSLFWSWFPIGGTGIRALLLFISALSVFVLRVAQLRLGARTTPAGSTTFINYLFRFDTAQTFTWYLFSSWWFSEVYFWSTPGSADLGWIALGKSWERKKLNERPIYLRTVSFAFAILQSVIHIYYDYDSVPLSLDKPPETQPAAEEPPRFASYIKTQLVKELEPLRPLFWYDTNCMVASILRNIVLRTLCVSAVAPFVYAIFVRRIAWQWSMFFAALVWDIPPTQLSYIPPYYPSLIYRSFTSGVLLVFLFEASNTLFSAYVAKQPLKRGQPFTAESKDPNGSLLTGFKSRKEIPKTFGLWELSYISAHPSPRRTTLFTDIDRPSGSLWTQIFTTCSSDVLFIQGRISKFLNPSAGAQPTSKTQIPPVVESLPRISTPLRQDNILTRPLMPQTSVEKVESNIGSVAKAFGQSPNPGTLKLPSGASAKARSISQNFLPATPSRKLLTQGPSSHDQKPSGGIMSMLHDWTMIFLRSSFGQPFRHTFARRARSVILGSPTSTLHPLLSSIRILSALAVASLTEDPYGRVAKDIPTLIRTFTATVHQIETFVAKQLDVHWTDVDFQEGGSSSGSGRKVAEVDVLVRELKTGLKAVVDGFGPFASELGIPGQEMAVARQLVSTLEQQQQQQTNHEGGTANAAAANKGGPEMAEVR